MLDSDSDAIIDALLGDLVIPKRKTRGQDRSKNYHKITISISQKDKQDVIAYAEKKGVSVSKLFKQLLEDKGIIGKS